jgi:hypothetical protein
MQRDERSITVESRSCAGTHRTFATIASESRTPRLARAQRRSSCPRAPAPDDPVATRTRSPSFELGTIALTVAASTRPSRSHRARYRNSPCEPGRGSTGHQGRQAQRTPRRPSPRRMSAQQRRPPRILPQWRLFVASRSTSLRHDSLGSLPEAGAANPWNRLLVFVSSSHAPKRGCCARSGMRRERRCPSQADRLVGRRR